ncbi:MAG TPA: heme-binding protein [Thiotrichales bacterium]|nr:heme-binding protein [Thiotrichales bacterium]
MNRRSLFGILAGSVVGLWMAAPLQAQTTGEQPPLVNIKRLSLESALTVAKGAIDECRRQGVQIAVTVIDRGGHPQVVLRDVLAMDITLEISRKKAHTAMAFNMPTSQMEGRFAGNYSVPKIDTLLVAAGGVPIVAGGSILGGVGVSGAPSGKIDEACAQAGVHAVMEELELADF